MNKYVALALLGSASACHWAEQHHKPLMGMLEPAAHCPKTDAPRLGHTQATRLLLKNMYTGLIKGWYQEDHDVVSDECFGEWMESTFHTVHDLKHRMHEDFWSVSLQEVKSTGALFLDTVYKNADVCQFERVGDDAKTWCIENPAQCIFLENLEERLFDNLFEILGSAFDLFKLSTKDDSCYTDMEQMAELYRFNSDVGELAAAVSGFDYKWDQSVERKHIKKTAFHKKMRDSIKKLNEQFKNTDPMVLMFPDLEPVLKAVNEFFIELGKMMQPPKIDMTKVKKHHQKKNTHQSFWGMPQQHKQLPTKKPVHHSVDPFAEMMKAFQPRTHHQQQQVIFQQPKQQHWSQWTVPQSQWGQIKMPNPHFEQGKYDFNSFRMF